MSDAADAPSGLGLTVFDTLRAQDEPWLGDCFVVPADFALIAGTRSALVFGEDGSGKTALYQALRARLSTPVGGGPPAWLVVDWRQCPSEPGGQLARVLRDCAEALVDHLACWPDLFIHASPHIRQELTWFIYRFLGCDVFPAIEAAAARHAEPGCREVCAMLGAGATDEYLERANPHDLISELVSALQEIGLAGVRVLLDPATLGEPATAVDDLYAFLSSLRLFEVPNFVYKLILPAELRGPLASAHVIDRRRVDCYTLAWLTEDLVDVVLRRVALAIGRPISSLDEVCADHKVQLWLERTGGNSPRGWLKCATPLAAYYVSHNRRVTAAEWKALRSKEPPPLVFDRVARRATVGWHTASDLGDVSLALLAYLWDHRDRVCSRSELFHQAYLPARYPGSQSREESPVEYDSLLDTAMCRLRDKIEPDAKAPLYVITVRGEGYKLENAW